MQIHSFSRSLIARVSGRIPRGPVARASLEYQEYLRDPPLVEQHNFVALKNVSSAFLCSWREASGDRNAALPDDTFARTRNDGKEINMGQGEKEERKRERESEKKERSCCGKMGFQWGGGKMERESN